MLLPGCEISLYVRLLMVAVEFCLDFFPLNIINLVLCAFPGCNAGSLFDLKYQNICFLTYDILMGKILSSFNSVGVICLKGQMPASEMQLQVCQQCRFVFRNDENSPVVAPALKSPEKAKCNYNRQNLESIWGKWNGDLLRDIVKDVKGWDLSKNTAYILGQINIDLGIPLSLMP